MNRRSFLQRTALGLISANFCPSILMGSDQKRPPNLITILIDDMGWKDTGFAGNKWIETPNIDKLAQSGMIFKQAYAAAPNCAPTRACLMTGLYPPRHGVFTVDDDRHKPGLPHHKIIAAQSKATLDTDVETIAEALKGRGYATSMVGMWNLGRGRSGPNTPTGQGFDTFKEPKRLGFEKDAYKNKKGQFLTHEMTQAGVDFIAANHDNPFYLYLAYHAVHAPFDPEPGLLTKYEKKMAGTKQDPALAATIESLDKSIGNLLSALNNMGIAGNTYIIFTSDNGGTPRNTAPLKGGKGSLYEGGIRVPACVSGPGIKPNQVSTVPISSIDIYPTLLELAGGIPRFVDGQSLVSMMKQGQNLSRDSIFWHFPCYIGRGVPSSAMRKGNMKLIEFFETQTIEMYDLENDPGEKNNLAMKYPEQAAMLYSELKSWQTQTNAPRPMTPNPDYDPSVKPQKGRNKRGKGK